MTRYSDATGERFGKWTVIADNGNRNTKVRRVSVLCDCGREFERCYRTLLRGRSTACTHCGKETHGRRHHRLYGTWKGMMERCYYEKHNRYHKYGAIGIDVYKPWHDVKTYIEWVEANLGEKVDGMSIDRIDNSRGYYPDNIRWADAKTQANNRGGKNGS